MITAMAMQDGSITIICDNQPVMRIDETSDRETINLFLYPMDSEIVASEAHKELGALWTHEVLANRKG